MTPGLRRTLLILIAVALVSGAGAYGVSAYVSYAQRSSAPSEADTNEGEALTGPRIVFRNTASGAGYGEVGMVPITDPGGERTIIDIACDRVDATEDASVCLHTDRGVVTRFNATLYDDHWKEVRSWPLAGIPSRTRLSPDSTLIGTTAFVTGHSYATVGFSTQTLITGADGTAYGNLEDFALNIDGAPYTAVDRNLWGVTFADDGDTFYATAASGGRTWLVRGSLDARTLTAVRETAECPSLSPDGTRVAYKKNVSTTGTAHWAIAVLDLAEGTETVLPEERSVDDQLEWLDDDTLLYGMPNDTVGDNDVWSTAADGSGHPAILIEHAWSPAVVR
ncbi:MAG: hypothetical protein ABWY36_04120 [Leifsonia sp.]